MMSANGASDSSMFKWSVTFIESEMENLKLYQRLPTSEAQCAV